MYPFARLAHQLWLHRNAEPLPPMGTHVSTHRCWPHDLDIWMELNNGRTLTLLDLGRSVLANRVRLTEALMKNKWGLTMAGVSVRYRRRIKMWEKFEVVSRSAGWDNRFFYIDQSIWKADGECATQALYRSAVTSKDGIVPPQQVFDSIGLDGTSPPLPDWVQNWIDADATRPWPPERP